MSFWLAALAYLLPTFPLGFLWHMTWFKARYDALEMYRDRLIIPMGLLSMVVQAGVFGWAYPRLFDTSAGGWMQGALAAFAVFGVLAWSFNVLPVAAKYRMTSVTRFMVLETAFTVLQFAVTMPLMALAWRA